jgi:HEAT repeat protein
VPQLLKALEDETPEVRFWSVFALGLLGDIRAVPRLEHLAAQDHEVVDGWWEVSREAEESLALLRRGGD